MNSSGGWTKYPNDIHANISSMRPTEIACMLVLVRETYGYHRQQTRLTYEDFKYQTGIKAKSTINASLKAIEARGFFRRSTSHRSQWQICETAEPEPQAQPQPSTLEGNGRVTGPPTAPRLSPSEPADSKQEENGRPDSTINNLELSVSELQQSNIHLERSIAQLEQSLSVLLSTISEHSSSKNEPTAPSKGSKIEPKRPRRCPKIEPNSPSNGSNFEPQKAPNGPKNEPFLLYKERSPSGKEREREEKSPPTRARAQPAFPIASDRNQVAKTAARHITLVSGKPPPHPDLPHPRSTAESELADHPATVVLHPHH